MWNADDFNCVCKMAFYTLKSFSVRRVFSPESLANRRFYLSLSYLCLSFKV